MSTDKVQVIRQPRKVADLSAPRARRQPPKRKAKTVRELSKLTPEQLPVPPSVSKVIDGSIIDNSQSNFKRNSSPGVKRSAFLITFVPNSSVREDVNPDLYSKLREEIASFARYILDPTNMKDILKPTWDNKDENWMSKVIGYGDDKVASIEDSKATNKRLHTHIYLPVSHKTKLQVNLDNLRTIADIMLKPLGITGPRIDVKVERSNVQSARDYVMKGTTDSVRSIL